MGEDGGWMTQQTDFVFVLGLCTGLQGLISGGGPDCNRGHDEESGRAFFLSSRVKKKRE